MKTLEEHNALQRAKWDSWHGAQKDLQRAPSGIQCPQCKTELRMDMSLTLTSNPPKRRVFCENCYYTGTVLA